MSWPKVLVFLFFWIANGRHPEKCLVWNGGDAGQPSSALGAAPPGRSLHFDFLHTPNACPRFSAPPQFRMTFRRANVMRRSVPACRMRLAYRAPTRGLEDALTV